MSLAKKIVLITAAVIAALTVSGMTVYKLIIVPKYIEPLLDSAAEMMKDSDVQDTVTSIAKDLADRGVLDENTFREYIKKSRKYTGSSTTSGSSEDMPVSGERINTSSIYDENVSGEETDKENLGSSLGIERARVLEKSDTSEAKVNESYSKRFNENNSSDGDWIENGRYTLDDAVEGEKINKTDALTLEEIEASTDLTGKVASAESAKDINTMVSTMGAISLGFILSGQFAKFRVDEIFFILFGPNSTTVCMDSYGTTASGFNRFVRSLTTSTDEYYTLTKETDGSFTLVNNVPWAVSYIVLGANCKLILK